MRRLVAALPFQHGIFVNRRGKTANIPFQFQVKSAEQTNVVPRAKLLEKESDDESPHSKRRLFRDQNTIDRALADFLLSNRLAPQAQRVLFILPHALLPARGMANHHGPSSRLRRWIDRRIMLTGRP